MVLLLRQQAAVKLDQASGVTSRQTVADHELSMPDLALRPKVASVGHDHKRQNPESKQSKKTG